MDGEVRRDIYELIKMIIKVPKLLKRNPIENLKLESIITNVETSLKGSLADF